MPARHIVPVILLATMSLRTEPIAGRRQMSIRRLDFPRRRRMIALIGRTVGVREVAAAATAARGAIIVDVGAGTGCALARGHRRRHRRRRRVSGSGVVVVRDVRDARRRRSERGGILREKLVEGVVGGHERRRLLGIVGRRASWLRYIWGLYTDTRLKKMWCGCFGSLYQGNALGCFQTSWLRVSSGWESSGGVRLIQTHVSTFANTAILNGTFQKINTHTHTHKVWDF